LVIPILGPLTPSQKSDIETAVILENLASCWQTEGFDYFYVFSWTFGQYANEYFYYSYTKSFGRVLKITL